MADQNNDQKEKQGGSKMLLLALVLTNILSLGGLGYLIVTNGGAAATADTEVAPLVEEELEAPVVGPTVALGTYNITLADPSQNRYLKAILKARVSDGDVLEEIEQRDPEIRDRIIDYLSSLSVKETQGARAKSSIRENLKKRINNILRTGEVNGIFLTEFVTQ
ncbi:MAG: flagellar basal body-associated FliL family protein [Myxococcales bacterium]|nr:flagellar basal body-associated FliL family protein [Myxococcales bacterium]